MDENANLAKRAKLGDQHARQKLIETNKGLVISVARQHRGCGLPLDDLVQEGCIGLLQAVDKFDPDKGTKFSTYAWGGIRQAIQRAVKKERYQQRTALAAYMEKYKIPSDQFDQEGVKEARRYLHEREKLEDRKRADCDSAQRAVEDVHREERAKAIRLALQQFSELEQEVVERRHGLNGSNGKCASLEEIAQGLKITRERVRQIERQALERLKTLLEGNLSKAGEINGRPSLQIVANGNGGVARRAEA